MVSAQRRTSYKASFDIIIVFGEGPIKPILFPHQLTQMQQKELAEFIASPLTTKEPNFYVKQKGVRNQTVTEERVFRLQHTGWLALKRMGRQNALAAGLALYEGLTKEAILSGGRTILPSTRKLISPYQLHHWPSEAELMADIIKRSYGKLYKKRYGRPIKDVLMIEGSSTNTLENFAYSVNKHPQLLLQNKRIGVLSARHHLKRLRLLAHIFGMQLDEHCGLSSQDILNQDVTLTRKIIDETNCADTKAQQHREEQWIKALCDPAYVTYWLGYVADVRQHCVLQKTMERLRDSRWKKAAHAACTKVGINLDEFTGADLACLAKENPTRYAYFICALQELKKPEHRMMPQ